MRDLRTARPSPAADRPWSVLDWVVDTCLLFGAQRTTAYAVAAEFARGLDPEPPPRLHMPIVARPILPDSLRRSLRGLTRP